MAIACCPYCGSDAFDGVAIRADGVDPAAPERFAKAIGHWFNLCKACDKWSVHMDGVQHKIDDPTNPPSAYSLPPV